MKSSVALLISKVEAQVESNNSIITFLNQFSYLFFRKNFYLFNCFDIIYVDGICLMYLLKLIGVKVKRISFDMTSIAPEVILTCIKENRSVYFIGSTKLDINGFVKVISEDYPKLKIAGHRNGYFRNDDDRKEALADIIRVEPNVVVVGMGTPYQEQFLVDLKNEGWNGNGYTCGGFIHQTAKGIYYYPKFYDKYNLRWLYRIIDEPKLFKRYFFYYPLSVTLFTFDVIKFKLTQK